MADGTELSFRTAVIADHAADCPTLSELREGQLVVGQCGRCDALATLDVGSIWTQPREVCEPLTILARQLRCVCGGRDVGLQVWSVTPMQTLGTAQFYRWR